AIGQVDLAADLLHLAMATLGDTDPQVQSLSGAQREELLARYLRRADGTRLACLDAGVGQVSIRQRRALELAPRATQQMHVQISSSVLDVLLLNALQRNDIAKWRLRRNPTLR